MDQAVINSGICNSPVPARVFPGDLFEGLSKDDLWWKKTCRRCTRLGFQLFLRAISWERGEIELLAALARAFLHTSVEPKYCFSSYIVTIKTELEEWCQSPVTRTIMHWTIRPEGQPGATRRGNLCQNWKCNKAPIAGEVERGCFPPKPLLLLSRENISAEDGDPVKPEWFIGVESVNLFPLIRPVRGGTTLVLIYFIKGG